MLASIHYSAISMAALHCCDVKESTEREREALLQTISALKIDMMLLLSITVCTHGGSNVLLRTPRNKESP